MSRVSTIFLALSLCVVTTPLMAQTLTTNDLIQPDRATPAISNNSNSISGFASDLLHDQKAIWTSPLHINKGDFEWLAPTAAGGAALAFFDHPISNAVKANPSLQGPSNTISNVGLIAPWAVPGTLFVVGATTHNAHALETGRLGIEAALDSEVVMQVIKLATGRMRPNGTDSMSFPSGHSMEAFALAAVLSREYHNKPLVVFGSYGLAAAVGLARVGALEHFPTDVVAGAVIGELIGQYVVHHHAQLADQ